MSLVLQTNIKSFLDLCQQQDVRSILIDPRILQSVMSSNPNISAPTCKYLCTHHKVTTFAVLPDNFKQVKYIIILFSMVREWNFLG